MKHRYKIRFFIRRNGIEIMSKPQQLLCNSENFTLHWIKCYKVNPNGWLYDEDSSGKIEPCFIRPLMSPARLPNSMVRDIGRSAEISEHVVVWHDSTHTNPVDTRWAKRPLLAATIWFIGANLCCAAVPNSLRHNLLRRQSSRGGGAIEMKLTKQSFTESCASDRSNYLHRLTMGHCCLVYWRLL